MEHEQGEPALDNVIPLNADQHRAEHAFIDVAVLNASSPPNVTGAVAIDIGLRMEHPDVPRSYVQLHVCVHCRMLLVSGAIQPLDTARMQGAWIMYRRDHEIVLGEIDEIDGMPQACTRIVVRNAAQFQLQHALLRFTATFTDPTAGPCVARKEDP